MLAPLSSKGPAEMECGIKVLKSLAYLDRDHLRCFLAFFTFTAVLSICFLRCKFRKVVKSWFCLLKNTQERAVSLERVGTPQSWVCLHLLAYQCH